MSDTPWSDAAPELYRRLEAEGVDPCPPQPCCAEWEPGVHEIDGFIIRESARFGRSLFDGKPFQFCPWCGAPKIINRKNPPNAHPTD